jgi:hypothetical protein
MTAKNLYLDLQPQSYPGFLQGPVAQNFGRGQGYTKDIFVEVGIEGANCRFINVCPADALNYHGSERGLPKYVGDSSDTYRARLLSAWDLWIYAGTAYGLIANLNFAGFNYVEVHENWDWGVDKTQWWKFWVIINDTIDHIFGDVSFYIGDGTLIGDGHLIGFTKNPPNEAAIRTIIHKWKPAYTMCEHVYIILDGWIIGQAGVTLGDGHLIGASTVVEYD